MCNQAPSIYKFCGREIFSIPENTVWFWMACIPINLLPTFRHQANQHLQQVVSSQSQEQESLRDQLRKAKSEVRTANIQLTELRSTLEQLKHEIQLRVSVEKFCEVILLTSQWLRTVQMVEYHRVLWLAHSFLSPCYQRTSKRKTLIIVILCIMLIWNLRDCFMVYLQM